MISFAVKPGKDAKVNSIHLDRLSSRTQIVIHKKVNDAELSQDLLQDVFIKIHQNIHTLSDATKLSSWVYQITRNTIADYFRKSKSTYPFESFDLAEQASEEPLYAALSNCLNQKINALPEKYKQAILRAKHFNCEYGKFFCHYSGSKPRNFRRSKT